MVNEPSVHTRLVEGVRALRQLPHCLSANNILGEGKLSGFPLIERVEMPFLYQHQKKKNSNQSMSIQEKSKKRRLIIASDTY